MSQLTTAEAGVDLVDRADVEALLRRFYGRALDDEVLAEPFAGLRATGLEAHVPTMCDFWETVLFRAGTYRRNALEPHQRLHRKAHLTPAHFDRWLMLWCATVDDRHRGPRAELAKVQAGRMAATMSRRITGTPSSGAGPRHPRRRSAA